jgi:hypothetical protein
MIRKTLILVVGVSLFLLFGHGPAEGAPGVSGRVLDAVTGKPVAGAVVSCGNRQVITPADGAFSLPAAGDRIRVRAAGYRRDDISTTAASDILLQPFSPKALYLSFYGIGSSQLLDPALRLIQNTELNALVIDVKGDRGMISFKVPIPLAGKIGAQRVITVRHPRALLASLKARGIYTIGRIVVFKDNLLATARPDLAVKTASGQVWRDGENLAWVDPFSSRAWDYNIAIAKQAAELGFDEIQFDYVRFPDTPGLRFSWVNNEENRVQAISGFLSAARKALQPYNVFISADVFGYVCWNRNDTHIGQSLDQLADAVDYISPMLYPSTFSHGVGRYKNPVANPYKVVLLSLNKARERTGLRAIRFRPWLQAFRDYAFDRRWFHQDAILAQTSASEEFGTDGWMLWNPRNVYDAIGLNQTKVEAQAQVDPVTVVR